MHYERCESNKTPYIFYLPFTLLQQNVFGIIHALWEILWNFENIGIRMSITSDTTVDVIVVRMSSSTAVSAKI